MTDYIEQYRKLEEKKKKDRQKVARAMTSEQQMAVKDVHEKVWDVLQTVGECQDIWMSQVRDLETAMHKYGDLIYDKNDTE